MNRLIVDRDCEIYNIIQSIATVGFADFTDVVLEPNDIIVVGRRQLYKYSKQIKLAVETLSAKIVYSNPRESTLTLKGDCLSLGLGALVKQKKLLLICCGEMEPAWPTLMYDMFISLIVDYPGNPQQMRRVDEIFAKHSKPYKFLFLNGRGRSHRKYLIERFRLNGVLDQALWTNLDRTAIPSPMRSLTLIDNDVDLIATPSPIQLLDPVYELPRYRHRVEQTTELNYVKSHLFDNTWADGELVAEPYIDTYFSLVTETVFDYAYSLRCEKTYKPIAQGHPFQCGESSD